MSDDTDETYSRDKSFLQILFRKVLFIIGIGLVLWIVVNKHAPEIMSPRINQPASPQELEKRAEMMEQKRRAQEARKNGAQPTPVQPPAAETAPVAAPSAATADEGEVIRLRQRIDELEARMKHYEEKLPQSVSPIVQSEQPAPAPAGMSDTDKQRVAQLEEQLTKQQDVLVAMKTQVGEQENVSRERDVQTEEQIKNQQAVIEGLKGQLEELQAHGARKLTAITAFGFMKEALLRGEPFTASLQQLDQQVQDAGTKALLTQFAPYAEKGVPTLPALKTEFNAALTKSLSDIQKDSGFSLNLQSLIRIRKVGEQQKGTDDESVLARAEAKLERGEVAASLQEIATLSPPAADAFSTWKKNAENFVQARRLTDALQMSIVQDKAATEAPAAAKRIIEIPSVEKKVVVEPIEEPKDEPAPEPADAAKDAPETPSEPTESE